MHYIVVQNCSTLQYNSLMRIMDSTRCRGKFPPPPGPGRNWNVCGTRQGHSSERITEKHCSAWIKGRQEKLEADVRSAWPEDFENSPVTTALQDGASTHGDSFGEPACNC